MSKIEIKDCRGNNLSWEDESNAGPMGLEIRGPGNYGCFVGDRQPLAEFLREVLKRLEGSANDVAERTTGSFTGTLADGRPATYENMRGEPLHREPRGHVPSEPRPLDHRVAALEADTLQHYRTRDAVATLMTTVTTLSDKVDALKNPGRDIR